MGYYYKSGSIIHSKGTIYVTSSKSHKHKKRTRRDKRSCKFYDSITQKCMKWKHHKHCNTASGCASYKRIKKEPIKPKTTSDKNLRYQDQYLDYPGQSGIHSYTSVWDVGLSKNIGTPSHTTFLKSKDGRRDKRRCLYYSKDTKYCQYYTVVCRGSTRCAKYQEK